MDEERAIGLDELTREVCLDILNSLSKNFTFTAEIEGDFKESGGWIPTLDMKFRVGSSKNGSQRIERGFFEKPMKNPWVNPVNSAMCKEQLKQIISNDKGISNNDK